MFCPVERIKDVEIQAFKGFLKLACSQHRAEFVDLLSFSGASSVSRILNGFTVVIDDLLSNMENLLAFN